MDTDSREEILELWNDFAGVGYVFVGEDGNRQEYDRRDAERED